MATLPSYLSLDVSSVVIATKGIWVPNSWQAGIASTTHGGIYQVTSAGPADVLALETVWLKQINPIRLLVTGGTDNSGDSNFGAYQLYCIKVDSGSDVPDIHNLDSKEQLEYIDDIVPEWCKSYSGYSVDNLNKNTYNSNLIFPYHYYNWENDKDHYFYLTGYDKNHNYATGLIPHPSNPINRPDENYFLKFNSNDAYIICNDNDNTRFWKEGEAIHSGTISFLFRPTIEFSPQQNMFGAIITKVNPDGVYLHRGSPIRLYTYYSTSSVKGELRFELGCGSNPTYPGLSSTKFLTSGVLYHITSTFEIDNGTQYRLKIYVNGSINANSTIDDFGSYASGCNTSIRLGKELYEDFPYNSVGTVAASGIVGDFRIYDYAFSVAEVSGLYNEIMSGYVLNPEDEEHLLFHSNFKEGEGTTTKTTNYRVYQHTTNEFSGIVNWISTTTPSFKNSRDLSADILNYLYRYTEDGYLIENPEVNLMPYKYSTFTTGELPQAYKYAPIILGGPSEKGDTRLLDSVRASGIHGKYSVAKFTTNPSATSITLCPFTSYPSLIDIDYNIPVDPSISNKLIISCKYRWDGSYCGVDPNVNVWLALGITSDKVALSLNELMVLGDISETFVTKTATCSLPSNAVSCILYIYTKGSQPTNTVSLYIDDIQVEYDLRNNGIASPWKPGVDLTEIRRIPRRFDTVGAASGIVQDGELFYVTNSGLYAGTEIPGNFFNLTVGQQESHGQAE